MGRANSERLVVERKTLESVIHEKLRSRIISLDYRPGAMIYENEISTEFGVSRTPVSRAFVRLAAEGLIKILPQRGAQISFLSRSKVLEAQEVRESLELTAFAGAATRWDEGNPAHLAVADEVERIVAAQRAAVERADHLDFARLDEDYHGAVLRFSGNMTLSAVVDEMRARLNRVRYLELREAHHEAPAILHHERILAAIRRNDVEETCRLLRDHLRMLEPIRETLFERHRDVFE